MRPDINDLVVALVAGDETHVIVVHHFINLLITVFNHSFFGSRNNDIFQVKGKTSFKGCVVTKVLDVIQELGRFGSTTLLQNSTDDLAKRFLG